MNDEEWIEIAQQITRKTRQPFEGCDRQSVGGGCINQGYRLSDGERSYFVKLNQASQVEMFEAEMLGLQQMRSTQTIVLPQPICVGITHSSAYIVLEWLNLGGAKSTAWAEMGRQLAQLHLTRGPTAFGWQRNNTIGSTPQHNAWTADWATFWAEHRIGYQLLLAEKRGGHFPQGDRLLAAIPGLLADHDPKPSLVHGDLWSGNAAMTLAGIPVIFDPATYWGDREVDIAMTELFGSFPAEFYQGYTKVFPLDKGYQRRKVLYNLYHILNHFNLFGGSYESQASRMITTLLS
jgi:fructosamine-3-kinase